MFLPPLCIYTSFPFPKTLQNPNGNNNLSTKPLSISLSAVSSSSTVTESAIKRIADKLRSLGFVEQETQSEQTVDNNAGEIFIPLPHRLQHRRVGHTMDTSWSSPENPVPDPGLGSSIQRYHQLRKAVIKEKYERKEKGDLAPTLAELTLTKEELRRLRGNGIEIKKKMRVGKAGITEGIVNGIHERWRKTELVKIVCDDICRLNMKRTHDLLERKTGGLVVWRSGCNIILYRGVNYKYPYFLSDNDETNNSSIHSKVDVEEEGCSSDVDSIKSSIPNSPKTTDQPQLIQGVGFPNRVRFRLPGEAQLAEEADRLLDGLGPRYSDWWGYEPLPVDADLLPATIPGYRRPFRLLPFGVKNTLTNDEMTILKRLGRPLPCHFVLGRNRKHKGLAAAMIKLWEKSEIAKIAVKRGVQNTNSELMAEELKRLTGGTLLSRDKEFFVFYRGKDFLPAAVSSAIEERRKAGAALKENRTASTRSSITTMQGSELGLENEGYIKEKKIVSFKRKPFTTETAIEKVIDKLQMALEKKAKAEKLLADLEDEEIKQESEIDKEGITEEERYMLRKVGLKMKPFLLLGRRGVFDGTVENMHLHWKYRELVKVICGGRSIEEARTRARTLEAESGGILVAVERVSKGYAIIVYRGKNYERPACLRPQTLLTKRQALKRSIEAQRRESLKLHVLKLNKNVDDLKNQLARDQKKKNIVSATESISQLAEESYGADSNSIKADGSLSALMGAEVISEHDVLQGLSDLDEDEEGNFEIVEPESTSELELKHAEDLFNTDFQHRDAESSTCTSDHESEDKARLLPSIKTEQDACDKDPSAESANNGTEVSEQVILEGTLSGVLPFRAARLSNRDRLLLRKQALKIRKRPVLAVGKSNIVSGVAKTIMTHFEKHPLAIVNVKGRAKGTSVQEVVFKLEQATGAVLVSQEPSKVILYRGWGGNGLETNKHEQMRTSSGIISPELLSAIRHECGLQKVQDEEDTP